ncbi:hypothetical protein [Streptomyces coeruleorubidus]|uniref:hypothetical protein n=1 Tax=Streptomyces coeruleorubidus TaxID=116188 RepID=UPI00367AEAF2
MGPMDRLGRRSGVLRPRASIRSRRPLTSRRSARTEIEITAALIQELPRDQHPDLAALPVRLGARG